MLISYYLRADFALRDASGAAGALRSSALPAAAKFARCA